MKCQTIYSDMLIRTLPQFHTTTLWSTKLNELYCDKQTKKNQESFRSFPQEFEIFNQILRLKKDYTQLNYT